MPIWTHTETFSVCRSARAFALGGIHAIINADRGHVENAFIRFLMCYFPVGIRQRAWLGTLYDSDASGVLTMGQLSGCESPRSEML